MSAAERISLHHGDCLDVLRTMADESVDSCVTDPPYALVSIVKRFGGANAAAAKSEGASGVYKRASAGFMGKTWDTGERAFAVEFWAEVLRVLKPGGHCLAFSGTRTYHRLACAIEDAGFEIRDQIGWLYGSGFPKSHDVAKSIDKMLGAVRPVVGRETLSNDIRGGALLDVAHGGMRPAFERDITVAGSPQSRAWEGWGTALKPAWEPIVMARKPLAGTVAANVLAHGTAGVNIDGCRVEAPEGAVVRMAHQETGAARGYDGGLKGGRRGEPQTAGRWPANVIHDGSEEVLSAFPPTHGGGDIHRRNGAGKKTANVYGDFSDEDPRWAGYADSGTAARFFYSAKADAGDRLGSKHPTVKPVDLMAYLCRLVTPPGGVVLDPFAGSGTTGMACLREGFRAVLCEREDEYVADIRRRLGHVSGADMPLFGGDGVELAGGAKGLRAIRGRRIGPTGLKR